MIRASVLSALVVGCGAASAASEPCMPHEMAPGGVLAAQAEECQARVRGDCGPPPAPLPDGSPDVAAIQKREQCPTLIECDRVGEERCRE